MQYENFGLAQKYNNLQYRVKAIIQKTINDRAVFVHSAKICHLVEEREALFYLTQRMGRC